jgi:hypothetical protein
VVSKLLQVDCCAKYYCCFKRSKGIYFIFSIKFVEKKSGKGDKNEKVANIMQEVCDISCLMLCVWYTLKFVLKEDENIATGIYV